MKTVNVAIIGTNFMGRAHSNAWSQVSKFFDLGIQPVLKMACGKDEIRTREFASKWGWEEYTTNWQEVIARDDIDIVDISLPTYLHHEIAIAAAKAGKHIFCEKPMATSVKHAQEMLIAAQKAKVIHYINHNYRRVPAVMLAKNLIDAGKLGRIFHWRGAYQQDWIVDSKFPLTWHLSKETAGSGPHGDLNSHSVDLAHFLVGDIKSVSCLITNFIKERPLPGSDSATFSAGKVNNKMGRVTVEDASLMQVEFENGALGSFEATRFATGRKNHNTFEIYGSKGSITFDLERMNELLYFNNEDPQGLQGFRTILATDSSHPFIDHWWPPGHIIGYEHTFIHAVADFLKVVKGKGTIAPNFAEGVKVMKVLEAALESAKLGKKIKIQNSTKTKKG